MDYSDSSSKRRYSNSKGKKKGCFSQFLVFIFIILPIVLVFGYMFNLLPSSVENFITDIKNNFTNYSPSKEGKTKGKPEDVAEVDLLPLPENPFAVIDDHARNSPPEAEESIDALAAYLSIGAATDLEKARAIYIWLTDKVKYDDYAYNTDDYGDLSPKGVLKSRKAVCSGFSALYHAIGKKMGLEIYDVFGYDKGYGFSLTGVLNETGHAWNVIKIDGEYRVFDATWGQGYGQTVDGKLHSVVEFNDYWFNVDPYESIFSHYPKDPKFACVDPIISKLEFQELCKPYESFFKMGFEAKELYERALNGENLKLVKTYKSSTYINVHKAPMDELLVKGQEYEFEFYIPRGMNCAFDDADNNWTYFESNKGVFKLKYTPTTEGELNIRIKHSEGGKDFWGFLTYQVVGDKI